ncbi:hypothetical protein ACU8KH_00182 [Lachancea thermotolerans]
MTHVTITCKCGARSDLYHVIVYLVSFMTVIYRVVRSITCSLAIYEITQYVSLSTRASLPAFKCLARHAPSLRAAALHDSSDSTACTSRCPLRFMAPLSLGCLCTSHCLRNFTIHTSTTGNARSFSPT